MRDQFANELAMHLSGKISDEDLKIVIRELHMLSSEYDIENRNTGLAIKDDMMLKCYQLYLVAKKVEGLSEGTLIVYKSCLKDFVASVTVPLHELTANDIRVYLYTTQQQRGTKNRTMESWRRIINGFLEWCNQEGYITKNPCRQINSIKFIEKPREPLSGVEMEIVRYACNTVRERALIEVLYSTGCRVSELVTLNREDVNFKTGEVILFGKGKKYRTSYINARAEVALKRYLSIREDNNAALFVTMRKPYKRITKGGIEYIVRNIGERSGIGRNLYPHLIRHTTATDALNHGMDVTELQKMYGHAKLDTTMIYAKTSQEMVKYSHQKYIV